MDEVAPAYTDPFPFLMTHQRQGGIFTLVERRTSYASNRLRLPGGMRRQPSKPEQEEPMRKPSMPPPKIPRLTRHLRRLQQALEASAQDTALFWKLCAPSRSRLH